MNIQSLFNLCERLKYSKASILCTSSFCPVSFSYGTLKTLAMDIRENLDNQLRRSGVEATTHGYTTEDLMKLDPASLRAILRERTHHTIRS